MVARAYARPTTAPAARSCAPTAVEKTGGQIGADVLLDRARSVGLSEDGTLGAVYAEVVRQAHFLAYLDVYRIVTFGILAVVPLCLLLHGEKNTADKASAPVPA